MKIGDLFLAVVAATDGFEADLVKKSEKAGDAAGRTLGQRMSAGVKANGAKIIGTTLAAGFGLATKGLLELEQVTADFAAATGASADEADRAGKAINAMAGRNLQPVTEIGEALTKVTTDLGLSGDEAERTTQQFLRFARATKQDAGRAVVAFDDILDAWGLTAADAGDIMDKLVVSSQEYGGSIEDNQRALAELAPALRAANLTVDDGVGLLNLFAASGVDSAVAVTGMTKALTKVKSPQELQALIADIIATEDPFLRAEKAADLFGAKAGAKLANVLKPGIGGLADFAVSTEDAAGATEDAADVLDSTWGARFQLLMKGATAAITGFGANFGPALTGMASLASLGASLGGGRLVGAIGGGLAGVWRKVAASPVVAKAIKFASGKAATIYLAGLIAGDKISAALSTAFAKVATAGPVAAAADKLGMFLGTAVGKAFSFAFAAAATLGILFAAKEIGTGAKEEFDKALFGGERAGQAKEFERILREEGMAGARAYLEGQAAAADGATDITARLSAAMAEASRGTGTAFGQMGAAAERYGTAVADRARQAIADVRAMTTALVAEARGLITGYYEPLILQDNLIGTTAQIAAAKRVLASKTATAAEKADARSLLLTLGQTQAEYLLQLAEAGETGNKAYRDGIKSLKTAIKNATGPAKAALQEILDKIRDVERAGKTVPINVKVTGGGSLGGTATPHRADGGPVTAGMPYIVGERRPELFVPNVSGRIIPEIRAAVVGGGGALGSTGTTVNLTMPVERAPDPFETARQLRRLADFGVLRPSDG